MHNRPLYPCARHQARSPRKDLRGRIMKGCMLTRTRRTRMMVAGASSAGAVSFSSPLVSLLN